MRNLPTTRILQHRNWNETVSFTNNLTMKDKQALLLYLGVVLLCAACFAVGIGVGRSTSAASDARAVTLPSATRTSPAPERPGR